MRASSRHSTLADVGEIAILKRIVDTQVDSPGVAVGPGDDCAVLRLSSRGWVWTTDSQVEGTHFERSWMTPRQIGRKSYLVNASDIAAMGGRPRFALVSLAAPADFPAGDLAAVQRGITEMACLDGAAVVGGNLSRAPMLEVSLSLLGAAPRRPVLRSGASKGDAIYVTGTLGDAALGLRALQENPKAKGAAVGRFRRPRPRVDAGRVLADRGIASAMIDVSDGLSEDLRRLCEASAVGAEIEVRALPVSRAVRRAGVALALSGGEDYELLCAVPRRKEKLLSEIAPELGCRMTRIGVCCDASHGVVLGERLESEGFEHFAPVGGASRGA